MRQSSTGRKNYRPTLSDHASRNTNLPIRGHDQTPEGKLSGRLAVTVTFGSPDINRGFCTQI